LLSLLCIIFYISKKHFNKTIWFGLATYITTLFIGVLTTNLHNERRSSTHYTHSTSRENQELKSITFRIKEVIKSGNYYDKYIIDILKIENQKVTGKVLLNIKKDSSNSQLNIDQILIATEKLSELLPPLNPNQFNYKAYLERQYIYHEIFLENNSLFFVSDKIHTLKGYASVLRNSIQNKLKLHHFKPDELAIINALILGQRQDISKTVYTNYTNAGAIHILAVSGLHVGILLLLLNIFLNPLNHIKHGKKIKMFVVLLLLWSYAIIAGASASIIRASSMFSVVAIGMHLKRPSNIYNTLAISAFIILLSKPLFLFDIGFQLSYLAVIAIVTIQPLIYNLWKPKLWLLDKLWQVFTVTVAAQFGIIPISLFYFHQFPGLFWLSNTAIIPLLGIILSTGILVIILAILNILPQILADCYGGVISLMNSFFAWIANQEQFLIKDIPINLLQVLALYFIIIALVRLYINQNYKALKLLFIAIISLQIISFYTKYVTSRDVFIIFHKSRNTVIGKKSNKLIEVFHNLDTLSDYKSVNTFTVANFISNIKEDTLHNLYIHKNQTILLVDSFGLYNIKSITPDFVLLYNSPRINLNRLIDSLNPNLIIADGSNYKSYITRWEETCKKRKLPFHHTGKKGAFIIKD
jgi:competence protein ComEC